ncbi:MAG: hypothetical protein CBD58_01220 [bacterium TMED198]|nr:MAG: hypothetical protein CBD58_01220 [bacterium TMED198]
MRIITCLILMGSLIARDLPYSDKNQHLNKEPQIVKPFHLTYDDLPHSNIKGSVLVQFVINENGEVIEPEIIDTFNGDFNHTIIDKVMAIEFKPALQNGRPIRVRYNLPILFK